MLPSFEDYCALLADVPDPAPASRHAPAIGKAQLTGWKTGHSSHAPGVRPRCQLGVHTADSRRTSGFGRRPLQTDHLRHGVLDAGVLLIRYDDERFVVEHSGAELEGRDA